MARARFDIWSIVLMMVAIWLGTFIGSGLSLSIGIGGGIIGSIVIGFLVYVIWTFISGTKISLFSGIIFALLVWIAQMVSQGVASFTGFGGGIIGTGISAIALSFLWGYFGATTKSGSQSKGKGKGKSK